MKKSMRRLPLLLALLAALAATGWSANAAPQITGGVLFSDGSLILKLSGGEPGQQGVQGGIILQDPKGIHSALGQFSNFQVSEDGGTITANIDPPQISDLVGLTYRIEGASLYVGNQYVAAVDGAMVPIVDQTMRVSRSERSVTAKQYAAEDNAKLFAVILPYPDGWSDIADMPASILRELGSDVPRDSTVCDIGTPCEIGFDDLAAGQDYFIVYAYDGEQEFSYTDPFRMPTTTDLRIDSVNCESSDGNVSCTANLNSQIPGCWMVQPAYAPEPDPDAFNLGSNGMDCSEIERAKEQSFDIVQWGLSETESFFEFSELDGGSKYKLFLFVDQVQNGVHDQHLLKKEFTTPGAALPQLAAKSLPLPDSVLTGSIPLVFDASGKMVWSVMTPNQYVYLANRCEIVTSECSSLMDDPEIASEIGYSLDTLSVAANKSVEIDVPDGNVLFEPGQGVPVYVERGGNFVLVFHTMTGSGDDATYSTPYFAPFAYVDNYKLRFAINFWEERTMEMIEPPYGWTTDSTLAKNSIVKPVEAEPIPLEPGKNVYVVRDANAAKPALAWKIDVPARPAAQKIALPENDLQYVFLTDTLEWDLEQICRIDYLDISCGESDEPETEREESWTSFGDFAVTPILLSRSMPSLRYRNIATESSFRSEIDSVEFKEDGPEFAPYAELSGQYARLNAAKNFSGTFNMAKIAFVTDVDPRIFKDSVSRFDAGLLPPGKHRATFALYLPESNIDEEEAFWPTSDEPILEEEGATDIERLREAIPYGYVLVAIDSAEIDVPDLANVVWAPDTALSPWAMTGLGGDVSDLSEAGLADADVLGWSETEEWDERWAKYRALDRVFAGEGVWIWAEDTVKFTRPYVGSDGTGDDYVSVRLRSRDFGWNLLANPYPFGIPASMAGDAQLYAWDREAGDYVEIPRNGVVAPFQAFWIHAEENATLDIPGRAMFESDVVDEPASAEPADLMRVSLRAGAYRDANNYVGVGDSARSRGEFPLAMGAGVTLTSLRDGSGWESDVRGADDVLHWSFAVSSRVSGLARGELALENRGALESLGYRLWTSQNGKLSEVRGDAPVAVALPASGSRVELYAARSKDLLEKELSRGSSGWKVRSSWDRAQGRADFRFSLDEPADLELRLLDASGRPIASQSASFGAGAQNWSWSASAPPASAVFWSISGGNLRAEGSF